MSFLRCRLLALLALAATSMHGQAPVITAKGDPSVSNDTIYRLAVDPKEHHGESYAVLLDDGVVRVEANGRGTQTFRQVVQVLDYAAAREWSVRFFPYDPSFGKLRLNWARVVHSDGSVVSAKPAGTMDERVPDNALDYEHQGGLYLGLEGVEPGTIVDISYTFQADTALFGDPVPSQWNISSEDAWVARSRLIVDVPESLSLHIVERNLSFARHETVASGRRTSVWATKDVPRVRAEPFSGDSNGVWQSVWFTTIPSWDALARWYAGRSLDRLVLGKRSEKKLAELVKDAHSWSDSLHAVYRWVAQDMQRSRARLIYSGFRPRTPDQTVEDFIGDSQDKSVLLVAMLRRLHMDATLVLASHPGWGPRKFPSLGSLQGVIIRIIHGTDTIFADPMSRYLPPGVLPRSFHGALVIALESPDRVPIIQLPRDSAGENGIRSVIVGRMDSAGIVNWKHTVWFKGFTQVKAREAFVSQWMVSARQMQLEQDARRDLPQGVGDSLVPFDGHDLRAEPMFSFTVRNGRATTIGPRTMLRLPFGDFIRYVAAAEWLTKHTPRRYPIDLSEIAGDTSVAYDLALTLPAGWKAQLPPDVHSVSEFGTVIRTYAQDGRVLHLTEKVVGARGLLPPERAAEVLAWMRLVTSDRAQYIVIRHDGR